MNIMGYLEWDVYSAKLKRDDKAFRGLAKEGKGQVSQRKRKGGPSGSGEEG